MNIQSIHATAEGHFGWFLVLYYKADVNTTVYTFSHKFVGISTEYIPRKEICVFDTYLAGIDNKYFCIF